MLGCVGTRHGPVWCVDEKTTSRLGDKWADQWDLRGQFTGYQWSARQYGFFVDGLLVRGICILKNEIKFAEKYVYWQRWKEERWFTETIHRIRRMIESWRSDYWSYNLGDSCNTFSGCPMRTLCESPAPDNWLHLYEHNDWDPLRVNEENGNGL